MCLEAGARLGVHTLDPEQALKDELMEKAAEIWIRIEREDSGD